MEKLTLAKRELKINNKEDLNQVESQSENVKTITVKKKTVWIIVAISIAIFAVILAVYTQTRKITGTWRRVYDDNGLTGMVVKVGKENGTLCGVVVSVPDKAGLTTGYQFEVNDIKWNTIRRTGWGQYEFFDLVAPDYGSEKYYDNLSTMVVSANGKKMVLTVNGDTSNRTGIYQEWEKIE